MPLAAWGPLGGLPTLGHSQFFLGSFQVLPLLPRRFLPQDPQIMHFFSLFILCRLGFQSGCGRKRFGENPAPLPSLAALEIKLLEINFWKAHRLV